MPAIKHQVKRFASSVSSISQTHYPAYVFGLPLTEGETPVFIYHDVVWHDFLADMRYLLDNGYRALSTQEYVESGGRMRGEKVVLVTFDDARRSFWDVAFPILEELGMRATLFVPTARIGGRAHRVDDEGVAAADDPRFVTWNHLRACAASGLVDVQSHGHRHALIYTSMELVDFVTPAHLTRYDVFEWPMRRQAGCDVIGLPTLGTPIYHAAPLLSATERWIEDESVSRACQNAVVRGGGAQFFAQRDWRECLRNAHVSAVGRASSPLRMPDAAFERLVASEFELSRRLFETEMGEAPRYLAYPWMLGSQLSMRLAAEQGIEAFFGVGLDHGRVRREDIPRPAFSRTKADWLRFLPGHGRRHLLQALPAKFGALARPEHLAH